MSHCMKWCCMHVWLSITSYNFYYYVLLHFSSGIVFAVNKSEMVKPHTSMLRDQIPILFHSDPNS